MICFQNAEFISLSHEYMSISFVLGALVSACGTYIVIKW